MEKECQHHSNCGGYCGTDQEVEFALCEDCLESYFQDEKHQAAVLELKRAIDYLDLCKQDSKSATLTGAFNDAWDWIETAARVVVGV